MGLTLKAGLFRCGSCGKPFVNPRGHTCVTRMDRKRKPGRTRVGPVAIITLGDCPACKKPLGNSLTHRCTKRTDFRKRKQEYGKQVTREKRAAAGKKPPHPHTGCRDRECERPKCVAYRDGYEDGYEDGHQDGFHDGYNRGFPDGQAACPRNHGG